MLDFLYDLGILVFLLGRESAVRVVFWLISEEGFNYLLLICGMALGRAKHEPCLGSFLLVFLH
jgi:hypothetical protein